MILDDLTYIEHEARTQGEADCALALIEEAYALFAKVNKARNATPFGPRRVRLGRLRYAAFKRWERRKHAAAERSV